jgi:hypothetical protein
MMGTSAISILMYKKECECSVRVRVSVHFLSYGLFLCAKEPVRLPYLRHMDYDPPTDVLNGGSLKNQESFEK